MSNWNFCHSPHTGVLFALWFKTTLWTFFHNPLKGNPLRSLIQNYSSKWLCGSLVTSFKSICQFKLKILPQSSHWNIVCSLIQNYFSIRLCGDNSSHVHNFKSSIHFEPFATVPPKEILFAAWFKNTLQNDLVVIIQGL